MHLKILSYNWHEPYLSLVSKLGHTFLIVEPEVSEGIYRRWDKNMRPIPDNVILISQKEAISQLDEGMVDLVIAHNIKDLVNVYEYCLPKILVFHNKLSTEIKLGNNMITREDYLKKIDPLLKNVNKIFISENKQRDWGLSGDVILPGIDVNEYGGYRGDNLSILRVGNLIKERDIMMGFSTSESIISGLPSITLGLNPTISESRMSSGFNDLLEHYRSLRVYVHTTSNEYEDGYKLSLLEAMAVGMPVVSIANKTSPIVNGINGYISGDIKYLKECAISLLGDKNLANSLGQKARDTVVEKFSQAKFLNLWISIIEKSIVEFLERSKNELPKKSIEINSQPVTTAISQYFKNVRDDIVSLVPDNAKDILEIGCAAGMTGNKLKKKKGGYVAGVELDSKAVVEAKKVLDEVIEGNIETLDLSFKGRKFDCILFADVLEHLIDPLAVLKKTRQHLRSNGTVIASIPNVQYIGLVSQLVEGNWTYQDEGILDRTHLRFFTYPEILKLFDDAGYKI
jgi:2-polyprenyl-3-methyl-5-hydroxy-6-metoxy-1,4-benzoquinol methylase